jgi:uncharacterized membrane protein YfcA
MAIANKKLSNSKIVIYAAIVGILGGILGALTDLSASGVKLPGFLSAGLLVIGGPVLVYLRKYTAEVAKGSAFLAAVVALCLSVGGFAVTSYCAKLDLPVIGVVVPGDVIEVQDTISIPDSFPIDNEGE